MDFKIEDSTIERVPKKFEDIVKQIIKNRSEDLIQRDIFLSLIIFIITENGFELENNIEEIIIRDNPSGIHKITLVMIGFTEISVKLIILPLGSTILLDVVINKNNSEIYTVCLPINKYVLSTKTSEIPMMFQDIKHLSYTLKNKIICPVKSSILTYYGYSSASLIGIPEEILFQILFKLPVIDIVSTGKTCKKLCLLFKNENFWHKLFERDFKNDKIDDVSKDWKTLYREAYSSSIHDSRRNYLPETLHELIEFADLVSYIDNPLWHIRE